MKLLMLTKIQYFHFEMVIVMPSWRDCGLNNTVTTMGYLHLLIGLI